MMQLLFSWIGSLLCGTTLYFCQDSGWFLPFFILTLVCMLKIVAGRYPKTAELLFLCSYMLPTYWFLHRTSAGDSSIGMVLLLVPLMIYSLGIVAMIWVKQYRAELFLLFFLLSELIFVNLEVGSPMLQVGSVLAHFPTMISWYKYTGIFGGSVLLFLISYILYKGVLANPKWLFFLIPIFGFLLLSFFFINNPKMEKTREVGVIVSSNRIDSILLANRTKRVDYIITPETGVSLDRESFHLTKQVMSIRRSLIDSLYNTTIFIGAALYAPSGYGSNAIIAYSREDEPKVRNKSKFVPFGEYLPYPSLFENFPSIEELIGNKVEVTSNRSETIVIKSDTISPLICYEAIFPDFMSERCKEGAEIFFISASNISINSMHVEMILQNIIRSNAIMTNRYIVRSAENGISYVISNTGECTLNANRLTDSFRCEVALNSDNTFYVNYNNRINQWSFGCIIALILFLLLKEIKSLFENIAL